MDKVEEYNDTELMHACGKEIYEIVESTINSGENVNQTDPFGETPLLLAVRHACDDEQSALRIVKLLLDSGANIDAQTVDGETSAMRAAYYNYPEILSLLIERGANINLRRTSGDTVLSSLEKAASLVRKRKRVLSLLLQAGAVR